MSKGENYTVEHEQGSECRLSFPFQNVSQHASIHMEGAEQGRLPWGMKHVVLPKLNSRVRPVICAGPFIKVELMVAGAKRCQCHTELQTIISLAILT